MTNPTVTREWLVSLGALTAASLPVEDAKARVAAYLPLLLDEFPEAAFTKQSLAHVARSCKFFPTFGELCAALSDWWRTNRPAIAAADQDIPERLRVAHIPNRERVDVSEIGITRRLIELEQLASESKLQAALASLGMKMLRINLEERAPERLHMIPDTIKPPTEKPRSVPEQIVALGQQGSPVPPSAREAFKASYGRYPGDLSPEHLKSVRNKLAEDRAAAGLPPTTERH